MSSIVQTTTHDEKRGAQLLNALIEQLISADAKPLARAILKAVRLAHLNRPVETRQPAANPANPQGPFAVDKQHACALLVYVPRNLKSRLIDDATGAYGYSHVAIDLGELDQPTGKRVMTESTTDDVVHRSFQDRYGARPYVRIPLNALGVDCEAFRACVNAKLGERYDDKEALTWGAVDDPAKQICSDLAGDCLPAALRADIARQRRRGRLHRPSVSVHRRTGRVFISPNGFCEYFGAPPGEEVTQPERLVQPPRALARRTRLIRPPFLTVIIFTMATSILTGVLIRKRFAPRIRL